jgi:hypothetical protein
MSVLPFGLLISMVGRLQPERPSRLNALHRLKTVLSAGFIAW